MAKELVLPKNEAYFDKQYKVIELHLQAENPTTIAKRLGIRRVEVLKHIDDWKQSGPVNQEMKDRVLDLIHGLDSHYSLLIKKQWEIVHIVDAGDSTHQMLAQKNAALKAIADLEDRRIAVLQRSGMLDNDELASDLAEMERQRDLIIDILQNDLCDKCKPKIRARLGEVLGAPQPIVVYDD
jgi:hypothetical protein